MHILSGDLHLLRKPGLWASRSEIAGDDIFALDQVIQICLDNDATPFFLGDVLDSVSNLPRPLVALHGALKRLNKPFKFMQGNHDSIKAGHSDGSYTWLSILDGAEHVDGKVFEFEGKKAYALDYFPEPEAKEALLTIPSDTEVLFLHGSCDLAMPINYHFKAEDLPSSVKYVFAGDWHICESFKLPNGGVLWYTGATYLTRVTEPLDKYVLKVWADGSDLKIEKVPLKTRPVYRASELSSAVGILTDTRLPEEVQRPLVLVDTYMEEEDYEEMAKYGHLYTTYKAMPMAISNRDDVEKIINDEDLMKEYVTPEDKPILFKFLMNLLKGSVETAINILKADLEFDLKTVQENK